MSAGPAAADTPAGAAGAPCPGCGGAVSPRDAFCEACGTELAPAAVSGGTPKAARSCPSCPASVVSAEGYCDSCGHKVPTGRDHQELDLGLLAGVTDRGLRHHRNEDAMALATADLPGGPVAVAVVADGISTSDRPDEASLAAAEAAVAALLSAVRTGGDLSEGAGGAVRAAAAAVSQLGAAAADQPSATMIGAVVTSDAVTLCWVGDSRAYWLGAPGPQQPGAPAGALAQRLTRDDSLAEEMVAAGVMNEAEAMASSHAHVVTRWLGGDAAESAPHVSRFTPPGPGVLLLCSDGLWNYRPQPAQLAELALPRALTDPLAAATELVGVAIDAGGGDNITVVLVPFPPARPEPRADSIPTAHLLPAAEPEHPPTVPIRLPAAPPPPPQPS